MQRRSAHARSKGTTARALTGAGLAVGAAFGAAPPAQALVFEVDNTSDNNAQQLCTPGDPGPCSFSGALLLSNSNPAEDDTITFASSLSGQTIGIGGTKAINDAVTISGPGAGALTIQGGGFFRLFSIDVPSAGEDVTFSGLTIREGDAGNYGGAIFNNDADLFVTDSVFRDNSAAMQGGAIYENNAVPGTGGMEIRRSTLTGNFASIGSGVYAEEGVDVIDSTFSGNGSSALRSLGYASVYSSTFSGNGVGINGGGLLANTIVANSTGAQDVSGSFYTYHALVENQAGATFTPNFGSPTVLAGDPGLGPLGANGGQTPTHLPGPASSVIDKGFSTLPIDQRGLPRTFDAPSIANAGNGADLGAVELQAGDFPVAPPTGNPTPTPTTTCKKKPKKKGKKSASVAAKKKPKKKGCGKKKGKKKK